MSDKLCLKCKKKLTSKNSTYCSKCFKSKIKLKIFVDDRTICKFCKKWDCKSNNKIYKCKNISYLDNYFNMIDKIHEQI